MRNSSLVSYSLLSPNHSGARTHKIDTITPHCVVGQLSCESIAGCFNSSAAQASSNYGIGKDGRVALIVDEGNRSWCSSSKANDQRAVTIECASDKTAPYAMTDAVYAKLIELCADICKRNGKKKLLWLGDKTKTLNYNPAADEMVITVHRWFKNKSCPGDWLYSRLGDLASKVTAKLGGTASPTTAPDSSLPAVPFSVKVLVDDLNIRTSPSSANNSNLTGKVTGKGTFTITKASGKWGYLKSGAGWIYLGNSKYTTIVGTTASTTPTNTTTTTTAPKKSATEVAKEIVAGKGNWGTGDARKKNLAAAGYNYTEVQNIVNNLMSGKTATTPTKKSNETIAKEVIAGKWGSGTIRKQKLTAAGYDYNAIQKLVNKMLR